MPPFFAKECPHCNKSNRFDLAELKKTNGMVFKKIDLYSISDGGEEFSVTCQHCGHKFKLTVKGGKSAEEN